MDYLNAIKKVFVDENDFIKSSANFPTTCSNTSVCLALNLSSDEMKKFVIFLYSVHVACTEIHHLVFDFVWKYG